MATAPKELLFGKEARARIIEGIRKLNKAVAITLGPKGRNALCEQGYGLPMVTKDGVTVARQINLPDPYEQMGNLVVREAASRTNTRAGDGTTTATIMAAAIIEEGSKHLGEGANPILIKKGIDRAVKMVVEELKSHATPVETIEDLESVAKISAQDEEIGKIAAQAVWDAGENGIVSIEKSGGLGIELEKSDGFQFPGGYVSPYMVTDVRTNQGIWENVPVLVLEADLNGSREIIPLMEKLLKGDAKTQQPAYNRLVVICDNVANDALSAMVVNKLKGNFHCLAVRAPGAPGSDHRKDVMRDIAILTGATYISKETGRTIQTVTIDDLGGARRVVSDRDSTMIVDGGGNKEEIQKRVTEIEVDIKKLEEDGKQESLEFKLFKERLAAMTGKAIVVRVGAASETEQKEKHYRVEDALCACRAARAEGVLPGGGVPYLRAGEVLAGITFDNRHEDIGRQIIVRALREPITWLAWNAGMDADDVIAETLRYRVVKNWLAESVEIMNPSPRNIRYDFGYDALREIWCGLLDAKVMDPMKVTREALENAASVAATWLTTETAIVEIPPEGGDRINVVSPQEAQNFSGYEKIQ